jgi:hyaluronoglucosaminidase
MTTQKIYQAGENFRIGTVEGFFGRQWSWQARRDHATFLAKHGFTTYLHAPKNEPYLRKQWFELYPPEELRELAALVKHATALDLEFGIGLSPFELYRDFSPANRDLLLRKLEQLNTLDLTTLTILFDDMMGDLPGLAETQLAIFDFIRSRSTAKCFIICPTYYSSDPILARHFGNQPERYLEELGLGLAPDVAVFWSGPKVISTFYPRDHLQEIGETLRRKPLLWDNYPVNDAKRLAPFLHLLPFSDRDPLNLSELCSGHLSNPMNQAYLSQLPLYSLSKLYSFEGRTPRFEEICQRCCSPAVASLLMQDGLLFHSLGVETLAEDDKVRLLARYSDCLPDPMAEEICDWLQGGYVFDPACLT